MRISHDSSKCASVGKCELLLSVSVGNNMNVKIANK